MTGGSATILLARGVRGLVAVGFESVDLEIVDLEMVDLEADALAADDVEALDLEPVDLALAFEAATGTAIKGMRPAYGPQMPQCNSQVREPLSDWACNDRSRWPAETTVASTNDLYSAGMLQRELI
jgi:hypothetical protein